MKYLGIMLMASVLFMTGCQQNKNTLPTEKADDRSIQVKDSHPNKQKDKTNREMATHLANIAANVPNVNDAVSVVAGPYAVVGIDVDKDLDRSRVGSVKYSVNEALYHDPYGKTAVVVADADVMERLRGMGDKIKQGYPVQGVVDELAAIVGRYMPDFPIVDDRPQEPDQNKQIIPDDEEKNLDDKQKEQSRE